MHGDKLLYDVQDVVYLTSLSDYEIRKAINAGELGHVRRGRRILIPAKSLEAFIETLSPADGAA